MKMNHFSLFCVTLLVYLRITNVFGGQICPTVCRCSWKDGKNVIDCDQSNLTEVPIILNNDGEDSYQDQIYNRASFNGNPLNFDKNFSLKDHQYGDIQELSFHLCKIKFIFRKLFGGLLILQTLEI